MKIYRLVTRCTYLCVYFVHGRIRSDEWFPPAAVCCNDSAGSAGDTAWRRCPPPPHSHRSGEREHHSAGHAKMLPKRFKCYSRTLPSGGYILRQILYYPLRTRWIVYGPPFHLALVVVVAAGQVEAFNFRQRSTGSDFILYNIV